MVEVRTEPDAQSRQLQDRRTLLTCALLGLLTLTAFVPVLQNDFVKFDDNQYVTGNPRVLAGLTLNNIVWALGSGYASNWHPLTWISHMLDVQLFGLRPAWHHAVSLLLHLANTLALFLVLRSLTGAHWRSAFVAALFSVHPLHVESVAWVAERKDVLSTFFFLLTIAAYARHVEESNTLVSPAEFHPPGSHVPHLTFHFSRPYALSLLCFALGLMSKPMLVTVPCLLLLLDFWPLQRFKLNTQNSIVKALLPLLLEKVPFLCLAIGSCVVTYIVQEKTHAMVQGLPFSLRLANAVVSYWKYLGKTVWPLNLAVFYPHPNARYFSPPGNSDYPSSEQWPAWGIFGATFLLLSISVVALLRLKRQPWFACGWFWYLGTLVPVIGIVQVGTQSMADRYTYIPLIGIFICVTWSASELLSGRRFGPAWLAAFALLALVPCTVLTHQQVKFWRTNFTLFDHALTVTSRNAVAEANVGAELGALGKLDLAQSHLRAAIRADPQSPYAYLYLGITFELQGRLEDAQVQFEKALQLRPWDETARLHQAAILLARGRRDEAALQYLQLLSFNPENVEARYQLGMIFADKSDFASAAGQFAQAVRLEPGRADAGIRLAETRLKEGKLEEAQFQFEDLVRRFPTNFEIRVNLGGTLWKRGLRDAALEQYTQALRLNPAAPTVYYNLGIALAALGRLNEALTNFAESVRLKPDYLEALIELGRAEAGQGKFDQAQHWFRQAVTLNPTNANLRLNLANAMMLAGQTNEAQACFVQALILEPDLPPKYIREGQTFAARGNFNSALARFKTAWWLKPDDAETQLNLAWILATHPQPDARDGWEALRLARRALDATGGKEARFWAALDAAYAETGQFTEALSAAEKTHDLAMAAGEKVIAQAAQARLALYRTAQPYHQ